MIMTRVFAPESVPIHQNAAKVAPRNFPEKIITESSILVKEPQLIKEMTTSRCFCHFFVPYLDNNC